MGRRRWGKQEEERLSLSPINFFSVTQECLKGELTDKGLPAKFRIADTAGLTEEKPFADVAMAWNEAGLSFSVTVKTPMEASFYPQVDAGDAVELFIDTRDMKSSGFPNRFCHHFFFLPEPVDGRQCGEITRFRTDDRHPLCDPELLQCKCVPSSRGYQLNIFLPSACLVGYNPDDFDRLGLNYRISRYDGDAQYLTIRDQEFAIDQNPALWASVRMVE